jgi:hypothetical protein
MTLILWEETDIMQRNALLDASKEVGLVVKTKYMLRSRYQKAGQVHDIKIASISVENIAKVKYWRTIIN